MCTEIRWRTHDGDIAGVTVFAPTIDLPDRLRITIGCCQHLYIPPAEARCLAAALLDAAADPPPAMRDELDDINDAIDAEKAAQDREPPAGLYHEPEAV